MLAFLVPGEWGAEDFLQLSTSPPNVRISFRRSADGVQCHGDVSVVFNQFSLVSGKAQEVSDIFAVFRLGPIHDCTGFMFLGVDAVLVDVKSTEVDFLTGPGAFHMFSFKTVFRQQVQHFADM
jgi:hypothetical protein